MRGRFFARSVPFKLSHPSTIVPVKRAFVRTPHVFHLTRSFQPAPVAWSDPDVDAQLVPMVTVLPLSTITDTPSPVVSGTRAAGASSTKRPSQAGCFGFLARAGGAAAHSPAVVTRARAATACTVERERTRRIGRNPPSRALRREF